MAFLTPLLLLGLGAIAVPVIVHLVQRERKQVIHFPSLMFVQKIPYQSVRRRRIRHWFLLLTRALAIALIVAAFARPFLRQNAIAAVATSAGAREVVILLDQSASMGYGDYWQRAKDEAAKAIGNIGTNDRATLVLFSRNAEENIRATSDRGRLTAALNAAKVTASATRFGPALKLAESILARSTLPRREAILISDFQKTGWAGSEDVRFAEGMTLTPISVAAPNAANVAVPSVSFSRASFSNQERITVTAGIANKSSAPATGVSVTLDISGHIIETKRVDIAPNAAASVVFAPFTLSEPSVHGIVRTGNDGLAADNSFDFIITPSQSVSVLIINSGADNAPSFYLAKALSIGNTPTFHVETLPAARVTPESIAKQSVVILNDTPLPPALAGGALKSYVERGGGLLVVLGEHSTLSAGDASILPGMVGAIVNRMDGRGATIGFRDYSHPVFEVFKAPRSGDFSAARVLRYRAIAQPSADSRIIARFDDGAIAAVERRAGAGRVVMLTTTLDDSWTDLPLKPVYLPLVHQLARYLGQYEQTSAWYTVGQIADLTTLFKSRTDRTVVTPSNERLRMPADTSSSLELTEHGVYEIRTAANASGRPDRIAVNLDPAESDLTSLDPAELVAAVTGHATQATATAAGASTELTPEETEKTQSLWWYLLILGLLLLVAENIVANRLSVNERFS
ncbi:MAG: BatA domain-containing protein [Acidobacteriaceae bacterium]|jgi:hypothetical protein|nr:BatA domain-containing protein [Acidobacteriaceae bacterium]